MYVYMCIYIYIYIYTHTHTHNIYIHTYIIYIYIYSYICICNTEASQRDQALPSTLRFSSTCKQKNKNSILNVMMFREVTRDLLVQASPLSFVHTIYSQNVLITSLTLSILSYQHPEFLRFRPLEL